MSKLIVSIEQVLSHSYMLVLLMIDFGVRWGHAAHFIDLTELPSLQLATYEQLPFLSYSTQDIHPSYLEGRIQQHRYTVHVPANLEWEAYYIAKIYGIEVRITPVYLISTSILSATFSKFLK